MPSDLVAPLLARVVASFNAGRHDEADQSMARALVLDPGHAALNHLAAALRLERGDAHGALGHVQRSLAATPDDLRVLATAVRAARAAGSSAQAVRWAERAAGLAPASADWACQHAALLIDAGQSERARTVLSAWIERHGAQAAPLYELGRAARALEDLGAARAAFEAATRLQPTLVPAWFALSLVRQDQGDAESAAQTLERVLALDPGHVEAAVNLGLLRQAQGDLRAAMRSYALAYRERPGTLGRIAHALCSLPCGVLWTDHGAIEAALRDALTLADPA